MSEVPTSTVLHMTSGERPMNMVSFKTIPLLKGMVHMITMLTYIAQIDIGEYKNPFKCPETTLVTLFWLLFVP